MKRFRLLKATALLVLAWFAAGIAADELRTRLRKRSQDHYQRDAVDFRDQAASYRRPVLFGEPIDGNAAVWYRQSFAHVRAISGSQLGDAVRGGFKQYPRTATAAINEVCAEANSRRVADALRCTYCDWGLSPDGVTPLEHPKQALVLGQCLTVLGHREAHRRDRRAVIRAYLASLSFSCDLGRGDDTMTLVGLLSADEVLKAIADLIISVDDDHTVLVEISRQLSLFDRSMPTGKPALLYERLRADKISLDRVNSWRMLAHWQLSSRRGLLNQLVELASQIQMSNESTRLEDIRLRVTANRPEPGTARERLFADMFDLKHYVALLTDASRMMRLFHAVQTVIPLQAWHIDHGRYPATADAIGLTLDRFGIRYEVAQNGDGFKLVDLHPWKPEVAVLIEHTSRRPKN